MKLIDDITLAAAGIAALRRRIHAHPELGFEEKMTSDLVAEQLQAWGVEVHRGMAQTGVVGIVRGRDGGACGRAIGLRADMDALPMQEHNTFAHASRHPGTMHACGHDGHTAMLLAAGRHLAQTRDFDGTVVLIFQPAEEGRGGAQAMVAEGLFDQYPMEAVFGMHNWPGLPAGAIAFSPGPVMAGGSTFKIKVRGVGAHAALPHRGVDPVVVAAQLIQAFQTIVSRNKKPVDTAVLSVTLLQAGEAINVIPASCTMEGTVRTFTAEVMDLVAERMEAVTRHTCAAFGAECDFEFNRRVPATTNHVREAEFAAEVAREVVGADLAIEQEPVMPSEDFSYMLLAKPGAYGFIGNGDGLHREMGHGEGPCTLHNPSYDFNDDLIPVGASYWVRLVQRWLGQPR
jgi:hippurate hydrolase